MAKKLSIKNQDMRRQFGAIVADGSKMLSSGRNRSSHSKIPKIVSEKTGKRYYGLHAELDALLKCSYNMRNATVYVYGQNRRSGKSIYSKPCELCEIFLKRVGIKTVVFSTYTGYEVINY